MCVGYLESALGSAGSVTSTFDGLPAAFQDQQQFARDPVVDNLTRWAGLRSMYSMSRTHAEITRDEENENITRMWDRLSKPSPILTKVLIWVSLGIWVSYTFLGAVSR